MIRFLIVLGICGTLMGCAGRTSSSASSIASTATQSLSVLTSEFVTTASVDSVSVGFKMTNASEAPVTLSFPTSPVSFYYEIHDENGALVKTYQDGVLASIETVTLAPGESLNRPSFTYAKSSLVTYQTSNTVRYYIDGVLHTDVIRGEI